MGNFNFDQKISSVFALLFILVLGSLVAWYSLSVGAGVIETAPNSKIFNPAGTNLGR